MTSYSVPASTESIASQDNLNSLFQSGSVASMNLNSFSLATIGGDNNSTTPTPTTTTTTQDDNGLSTTTIIILATVIPIVTIVLIVTIVCICLRGAGRTFRDSEYDQ